VVAGWIESWMIYSGLLWYIAIMRILFIADGRSPTTLSWLRFWLEKKHEVHLVSSYPCDPPPGVKTFHVLPAAFGSLTGERSHATRRGAFSGLRRFLLPLRYLLGPASLPLYQVRFRRLVESIQPEIVHALRIPYEGMLGSVTPPGIPFIVSIWGNDITLHAHGSPWMAALTRRVLRRADGLFADANRDITLASKWGLRPGTPTLVVPGAGGIHLDEITTGTGASPLPEELPEAALVVNPRGQRPGSLRQDIFFKAIPLVLDKVPAAYFVCPALKLDPQSEGWVASLGIGERTRLWAKLSQPQLWKLLKNADVFVSPSLHDGTPNSLLEAMACGCFPVVGDIESMREWITDGINGLLVDASDEKMLADAIARALNEPILRSQAAKMNLTLLEERADYTRNMQRVTGFYQNLIGG
jgi:glycosyltransferase involved in cell wall biosynthesis